MNSKDIIKEEVKLYLERKSGKELVSLLENTQFLVDALDASFDSFYNKDNQISPELWNTFISNLEKVIREDEEFQRKCKEINAKLYCVKKFAKIPLAIAEGAEDTLKFELKKYYSVLQVENNRDFKEAFFSLPFEFTSLVVRYAGNVLFKSLKQNIAPTLPQVEQYYIDLVKLKNKFTININKITIGQSSVFSLKDLKLLLDTKAFYEHNPINIGALEFAMRTLTGKKSSKRIVDEIGEKKVFLMKQQILTLPSYIKFLEDIKEGVDLPFFTEEGLQTKNRSMDYNEFIQKYFFPDSYIPSVKDEKQDDSNQPVEEPVQDTDTEQPSPEELNPDNPIEELPAEDSNTEEEPK